jgi:translation initiation factor 6 (eIF-6)
VPLPLNEYILKQLLINIDQSSISDQLSVLCHFFVNSLKTLLLSKLIKEKERSTIKSPASIDNIETNIKQIGNLINKMNEDCSNELIKNKNKFEN